MSDTDLKQVIIDAAQSPQSASGEAGSVTARSIEEIDKARRIDASESAVRGKRRGLILAKIRASGSI